MRRYFELRDGKSEKFWEASLEGPALVTRHGRIGAAGQTREKAFDSEEKARKEFDRLVREKLGKGYVEVGAAGAVYLEHPETGQFFELSEDNNQVRIRRGAVGKPCLVYEVSWVTPGRGREHLERLREEWLEKGFAEAAPSAPVVEGSRAVQLWSDQILDHPVYSRIFRLGWAAELRERVERILLFPDGLSYDGDFDLEEVADMGLAGALIVEGDVRVSGVFSQLTYTYPASTLILGDVYAHSLGHADSFLRIDGDVRVENIVYGHYNDGQLEIGGDVYGGLWYAYDHSMWAEGHYHIRRLQWGEAEGISPKLLDLDGGLDQDELRRYMFDRKSPFKKGYEYAPPVPEPTPGAPQTSELYRQVRALAEAENVEGLTQLLETWPERTEEWAEYVRGRLAAPSSTPAQKGRLRAALEAAGETVKESRVAPQVTQVETFQAARAEIKAVIEAMKGQRGARKVLKLLETPPPLELFPPHSHLLLVNALLKNKDFPNAYLGVVERLLDLGADPRLSDASGRTLITDSLVTGQPEVAALMERRFGPQGGQVETLEQADPAVATWLYTLRQEGAGAALEALNRPPPPEVVAAHSWLLLAETADLIRRGQPEYLPVLERLLELGARPRTPEADLYAYVQNLGGKHAEAILELLLRHHPELASEPWVPGEAAEEPEEVPPEELNEQGFWRRVLALGDAGDKEGLVRLFETWPKRGGYFQNYLPGQIGSPQVTHAQRVRLARLRDRPRRKAGRQALYPDQADPEVEALLMTGAAEGPQAMLEALRQPPAPEVIAEHSWLLLSQVVESVRREGGAYLPVLERLLELGADPTAKGFDGESALEQARDLGDSQALELVYRFRPELRGAAWRPPPGGQVEEGEQAHPEVLALLQTLGNSGAEATLEALRTPPAPELIAGHSWILLLNALLATKARPEYLAVTERLLELGADPRAEFAGMNISVPRMARTLGLGSSLELLRRFYPDLAEPPLPEREAAQKPKPAPSPKPQPKPAKPRKSPESREALEAARQLNQQASDLQTAQPAQALELYEGVIAQAAPFLADHPDDFAYQQLFALQGRLWCVNELVEQGVREASEAERLAREILEFTAEGSPFYYTAEGGLSRAAQTLAHNTLAWYALGRGELEAALGHADAALETIGYSEESAYPAVLENKTRILLALGRADDAHALAYAARRRFPGLPYFEGLAATEGFRRWEEEN